MNETSSIFQDVPAYLYPFTSHFFDRGGGIRMHYVDEGPRGGETVVMVHGNPTWSFYFRSLIRALSDRYRCLAPDHVGCGASDKPNDAAYDYTLSSRVADFGAWIDAVAPHGPITLVLHDWGGMIGMAWAVAHPERIARIVLLNTGAFPLPAEKPLPATLRLGRDTALGAFLISRCNAFSRGAIHLAAKRPLAKDVAKAYVAPYRKRGDRLATLRFVQDIPLSRADRAYPIVENTAAKLPMFGDRPILICWGEKDFVFDKHFLAEWKRLYPNAVLDVYPDAGHYVLEDAGDRIVPHVREFLDGHPLHSA